MQNHCVNILRLQKRDSNQIETILQRFIKDIKDIKGSPQDYLMGIGNKKDKELQKLHPTSLDFHSILPMPKELRESMRPLEIACEDPKKTGKEIHQMDKKIRYENLRDFGYETPEDWAQENWGTEFNCYDFHKDKIKNSLVFDTSNTPPLPVIQELAKQTGKNLVLFYAEPGAGIYGEMKAFATGETEFRDYNEENIPQSFHKEFPNNYPVSTKVTKPSKPANSKAKKTKLTQVQRSEYEMGD